MQEMVHNIARASIEIVTLAPMPWRISIVLLVLIIMTKSLLWPAVRWLSEKAAFIALVLAETGAALILLPDYLIAHRYRLGGKRPPGLLYLLGDGLSMVTSLLYKGTLRMKHTSAVPLRLRRQWLLLAFLPILLWYARPFLDGTMVAGYIDSSIHRWYDFEQWAMAEPHYRSESPHSPILPPPRTPTSPATATPVITPTPQATPTQASSQPYLIHVVEGGDNLNKLAKQFNTTLEAIVEANQDNYPSLVGEPASIHVGCELRIPQQ